MPKYRFSSMICAIPLHKSQLYRYRRFPYFSFLQGLLIRFVTKHLSFELRFYFANVIAASLNFVAINVC